MSGMDFVTAMLDGSVAAPPISHMLDMYPTEGSEGRVVFELTPGEQHYNPIGVVHGGITATLLDTVMGVAVHSTLPKGFGYTTLEVKVNFVRPVTSETGPLRGVGEVIHRGGRVATAEGRVTDSQGKLVAHATTTCLIFEFSE
ncbi:MAG: PaaI family thioesterase [Acidimicrobiia bacterium]|nr:PaaI family thioesterase [Acidimicrobiia bacterium]